MLIVDDTIINPQYITYVYYNRNAVPGDEEHGDPGQPQSIILHYVSGESQSYYGPTADALWEHLSAHLKTLAHP